MTFEETLVLVLDAQASPIEEEEVMSQMAVSPEKRALLHTHLRMRDALGRDAMRLRPSRTLRDGTVALLLAAAGTHVAESNTRSTGGWRLGTSHVLVAIAAALIGATATWALLPSQQRTSVPAPVAAIETQTQAPQVSASIAERDVVHSQQSPPRVVHETVIVPETIRVAQAPVVVHDTVVLRAPVVSVPPTVTIQRETVYVAPRTIPR